MTEAKKTHPGLLISFEGSEGSGKSTQIERLAGRLRNEGHDVVMTREPGGTEIGEEIRHLLKHAVAGRGMCPETELLLFAAARAQLVREVILPAAQEGKIILCDRFLDSTTVYQGVARQLSDQPVDVINRFAVGSLMPDLTIVLDIPAEVGLARVQERSSGAPDRMEEENVEFYRKVRKGYLLLVKSLPERFTVFDGTLDRNLLEDEIWEVVRERFLTDG